jgi:hypothetical protein
MSDRVQALKRSLDEQACWPLLFAIFIAHRVDDSDQAKKPTFAADATQHGCGLSRFNSFKYCPQGVGTAWLTYSETGQRTNGSAVDIIIDSITPASMAPDNPL